MTFHKDERVDLEDKLSTLPSDILIDIISNLPLKSAIATGVLSSSWRDLWKYTCCIDLNNNPLNDSRFDSCRFALVDELLMCIKSPIIHRFDTILTCDSKLSSETLTSYIDSWLRLVCQRGVQEIHIELISRTIVDVGTTIVPTIPHCLFETSSLTVLKLCTDEFVFRRVSYHLPALFGNPISLPNLRRLTLAVQVTDHASIYNLANLISSCPSLENLSLGYSIGKCSSIDAADNATTPILRLSNHSLKRLHLWSIFITHIQADKVVIDAPFLEYFSMKGMSLEVRFLNTPKDLLDAIIIFQPFCPLLLCQSILNSISSVRSLYLFCPGDWRTCLSGSIFHNLTSLTCRLLPRRNLNELPLLLQNCPCLSPLVLIVFHGQFIWSPPKSIGYLTKVKRIMIKIKYVEFDDHLLNFIKHYLCNAPVLEQFVLSVDHHSDLSKQRWKHKKSFFHEELNKCAKASSICQIELITH